MLGVGTIGSSGRPAPASRRFRTIVVLLGLASIITLAVGALAGRVPDCATGDIVSLELARTQERAVELIGACDEDGLDVLRDGLRIDTFAFIPLYVATVALWSILGARRVEWSSPLRRRLVLAAACAIVVAGLFDLVENHYLGQVVDAAGASDAVGPAFAASVVKWMLVLGALPPAIVAMVRCIRAAARRSPQRR